MESLRVDFLDVLQHISKQFCDMFLLVSKFFAYFAVLLNHYTPTEARNRERLNKTYFKHVF